MAQKILRKKFNPMNAYRSHEGTILASDVVPEGYPAPFQHAYGYLLNNRAMAGHSHPTDEIYVVMAGTGYVIVGGKTRAVKAGDTIVIPAGEWHTMLCTERDTAPFLWAALWWNPVEPTAQQESILVQRFTKETAKPAHGGTILADRVVPEEMKTPFDHAYGYLEKEGSMEEHSHPTQEIYFIYSGAGSITVDGVTESLVPGEVVAIPPNAAHSMTVEPGNHLLWAALWWDAID